MNTNQIAAEEAVEALKNLASLAGDLDGMIRQFNFDKSNGASPDRRGQPAFLSNPQATHA